MHDDNDLVVYSSRPNDQKSNFTFQELVGDLAYYRVAFVCSYLCTVCDGGPIYKYMHC